jgi:hypothetical protein
MAAKRLGLNQRRLAMRTDLFEAPEAAEKQLALF